jgi:hypothetical protein
MIDIVSVGNDIGLFDTQTEKAKNILSVQLGSLEYLPGFGIDLKYFLDENFIFQNESFQAYLIEVLARNGVNVSEVIDVVGNLFEQYTFLIPPMESGSGLVSG